MLRIVILACYLIAAWRIASLRYAAEESPARGQVGGALAVAGLGLAIHAYLLFELIRTGSGPDLSIANVLSLVGFGLALAGILSALRPRLRGLGAVLLPVGEADLQPGIGLNSGSTIKHSSHG